jgi:hypothetical protein
MVSDGRSAAILYWVGTSGSSYYRRGVCRNKSGAQEVRYGCNRDFREGYPITIQMGTCNQTPTRSCTLQSDYSGTVGDRYHTTT